VTAIPWEDHLLERKTERNLKDIRRTAVAFANSVRPGHVATIVIGECNDGTVPGISNGDELQRSIRQELEKIYPPISWRQAVYEKAGKSCIRLEIEYDGETPHFGDAAWIRRGSETVKASDEMLQRLLDFRQSKVRRLAEWIGREVTVSWSNSLPPHHPNWMRVVCQLVNVTSDFATFKFKDGRGVEKSEPIGWLEISWDDDERRLRLFVNPQMSQMF
jgi:Putative DNA-binding domain